MSFSELVFAAGLAMLATSLGSVLAAFSHRLRLSAYAGMLGFSSGVMSFAAAQLLYQSGVLAGFAVSAAGFCAGVAAAMLLEFGLPHAHHLLRKRELAASGRKALLLAGAVTLHNIPEGLSIASAFALSPALGWVVAASISVQDVVEGFAVAAPLVIYGLGVRKGVAFGVFSGLVEFLAAAAGFFVLSRVQSFVPAALAFSAGCMSFVVVRELLPDAVENSGRKSAAAFSCLGVLVAAALSLAIS